MTEKIKQIVDKFFQEHSSWGTYKYRLNSSYWIKFQFTLRTDCIRVYVGVELPGYEFSRSGVYKMSYGALNDDNEGLAALILMIYREIEKMNSDGVSIGYDLYKSVLADNDKLREEIKDLKKLSEDWHNKYIQEKMDHTTTQCRAIFAKYILNGDRDERVKEHIDTYGV
jgi:hypothetical protein